MKLRASNKLCKRSIHDMKLKILQTHGRTFVVKKKQGLLCMRWYAHIIVAENHPQLESLIAEGKMPIKDWKLSNKSKLEYNWTKSSFKVSQAVKKFSEGLHE